MRRDISGRAVKNVHVAADEFEVKKDAVFSERAHAGGVRERGVRVARARGVQRREQARAGLAPAPCAGLVFVEL